jgi:hypothetical protein
MTTKDMDSIQLGYPDFLTSRQAFWLKGQSTGRAFPVSQWHNAAFVPLHSNGWFAMESHHLSF